MLLQRRKQQPKQRKSVNFATILKASLPITMMNKKTAKEMPSKEAVSTTTAASGMIQKNDKEMPSKEAVSTNNTASKKDPPLSSHEEGGQEEE